jgi:AcrR family transcriptional regulator
VHRAKVIPIQEPASTRERLIAAVGAVLARRGFRGFSIEDVILESGVRRALVFRKYDGLTGLITAFGNSPLFWPTAEELLEGHPQELTSLTPEEQVALFFKRTLAALRRRPNTLRILAWEVLESSPLSSPLEEVRVRTALEYFELLQGDIPEDIDLTAIVLVMAAAVQYLLVRSQTSSTLGGVDLRTDAGWHRIEKAIDVLLKGTLGSCSDSL